MDKAHWLAGPVRYETTTDGVYPSRTVKVCKWEFIAGTASGEILRRRLHFSIQTRKWSTSRPAVDDWERHHWKDLAALYRPIAVLRVDLPKGPLSVAMRFMIGTKQLAEVTALAIRGGKPDG